MLFGKYVNINLARFVKSSASKTKVHKKDKTFTTDTCRNIAIYTIRVYSNRVHILELSSIQVKWAKDNLDGYLNFYSVSGDGRVTNWTIVKTALWCTDVLSITFSKLLVNFPEKEKHKSIKGWVKSYNNI